MKLQLMKMETLASGYRIQRDLRLAISLSRNRNLSSCGRSSMEVQNIHLCKSPIIASC